jgi:hypothetical protein
MKTWKRLLGASTVLWAAAASQCNPSNQYVGNADLSGTGGHDLASGGTADLTGTSPADLAGTTPADLATTPLALTLIAPAIGPSTGGIPLTLTGTGFAGLVTVTIGGIGAVVTQMTPTQITVTLPVSVGAKGKATVVVRNGDGTIVTRGDLFSYYFGTLKFDPALPVTVGNSPYSVAIATMRNMATKPDLVVANNFDNNVGVLFGNGNGTFQTMAPYTTGNRPRGAVLADFNNDTYPDVVSVNYAANSITVLINDKAGALGSRLDTALAAASTNPVGIAAKVVTGSTYPDLVTANSGTDDVNFFQSKPAGGLSAATSYTSVLAQAPSGVIFADVNNDTFPDIIVANQFTANVTVYLGTGTGGFGFKGVYPAGKGPAGLVAGDFDGDGKVDLLVSLGNDGKVAILPGTGTGAFNTPVAFLAGTQPSGIALADFNLDGKPDVATALTGDAGAAILLNTTNGTPSLGTAVPLAAGMGPLGIAVGDVDNDGRPDVVVANSGGNTLSVFLNKSQ